MTTLTLITLLVIAYGAFGSQGYGRALALGGATSAGAALAVGGIAVPTFYAVALGTAVALAFRLFGKGPAGPAVRLHLPPGATLLLAFLAWSTFVTFVSPLLFDGLPVLAPTGVPRKLIAGTLTSSNIAQIGYLALGVCVVVFIARSPTARPQLIGLAAGLTTLLSLWRYLHQEVGAPFPEGVFDNSPTLAFIETAPGGAERFRGILSEPSSLAGSSLVTISYMLPRAFETRGWHRAGTLFVAATAAYLGVISTSTTFVVAGVATATIATLTFTIGFLRRRASLSAIVGLVICASVIAAVWILPGVVHFVQTTVNEKVLSPSYNERSGADSTAYGIFLDTYGFGVGLGSSRASSFLADLLSITGIIGTLLFASTVLLLIHRSSAMRTCRPVFWALMTLLVAKLVAGPGLSDSSGILWMSLGLLSRAAHSVDVRTAFPATSLPAQSGQLAGEEALGQ